MRTRAWYLRAENIISAVHAHASLRDERAPNRVADAQTVADAVGMPRCDLLDQARDMKTQQVFPEGMTYLRGIFHVSRV